MVIINVLFSEIDTHTSNNMDTVPVILEKLLTSVMFSTQTGKIRTTGKSIDFPVMSVSQTQQWTQGYKEKFLRLEQNLKEDCEEVYQFLP